ncbi:MAG: co-chaperone GroES [Candidatus Pacebacteria bacterium]|nr:co-chaperone GroES [Candidatus Paceibacterota bacterium]
MIKPTSDRILIEPLKEEKKKSSIILPDTIDKEKSEKGKVVAVGAGKMGSDGKRIAMEIKKGDVVIFTKYGPRTVKVDDKEYLIAREDDILAIVG